MADALARLTRRDRARAVSVMHVCGSHEQAIAKFGLRAAFPSASNVIMGPGCPVCVTDTPEVDGASRWPRQGVHIATYGDMLRVPGTVQSLADAQAEGAKVDVVYSVGQAVELARTPRRSGRLLRHRLRDHGGRDRGRRPEGRARQPVVLSAHKYIPPAMEIVAEMPETNVEGFLAAGHAATITGWGVFEPFVERHQLPVVVAGFEPLDILAGAACELLELVRDRHAAGRQHVPALRHAARATCGRRSSSGRSSEPVGRALARHRARAQRQPRACATSGRRLDARRRFTIDLAPLVGLRRRPRWPQRASAATSWPALGAHRLHALRQGVPPGDAGGRLHGEQRGHLQIWHQYGGHPDLGGRA